MKQKYHGDITVIPELSISDAKFLFADPDQDQILNSVKRGERATWPAVSMIWNQCKVELVLDQMLLKLQDKNAISKYSENLPMMYRHLEID